MRKMFLKILALFFVTFTSAQNINVSGNVKDNNGIPFPVQLFYKGKIMLSCKQGVASFDI